MICYSAAKKLVEEGQTTWEDLESCGLCLAKRNDNPFLNAFKKVKGNNASSSQ